MSLQVCRSFSIVHDEIVRQISCEVMVSDGMTPDVVSRGPEGCGAKRYTAIWDTGATATAITRRVVDELRLPVISRGTTCTAGGQIPTTGHFVHVWLPNKVVVLNCVVSCVDLAILGIDILIGMDIIGQGDFSISNYENKTIMSFREPSIGHIDFTKQDSK